MKYSVLILFSLASVLPLSADSLSDLSGIFDGVDAPLKEGLNAKLVVVRDGEGGPIPDAKVIVDYNSVRNPPAFVTDERGFAHVQVKIGFWAIRVVARGKSLTVRGDIEWPLIVVLSTKGKGT